MGLAEPAAILHLKPKPERRRRCSEQTMASNPRTTYLDHLSVMAAMDAPSVVPFDIGRLWRLPTCARVDGGYHPT